MGDNVLLPLPSGERVGVRVRVSYIMSLPQKIFCFLLSVLAFLPLSHITSDPGSRQVFGLYSASYFGLVILWWCACGLLLWVALVQDVARRKMLLFKSIMLTFSVLLSLLVVEVFLHARPGFVPMSVRSRLAAGGAFLDFQGVAGSGEIPGVRYPSSPNQSELMTVSVSNLLSSIKVVKEGDATSTPVYRRTTDAQGLCNPSNITGKVHCLFIGDSFTEMSHLPWEQRWPAQLALAKGWSLRNLGKGGISPAEGVPRLPPG